MNTLPQLPAHSTTDLASLQAAAAEQSVSPPQAQLAWTAVVDIGPREPLGLSSGGQRFIVPILGGRFWGGPAWPMLKGVVRPGGADRQCQRADGVRELQALYEMETADGAVLTIDNRVLIDESVQPQRYAISHISVLAPEGPHAWLNRRVLVGTLHPLRPLREAVVIRAYVVTG